MGVAALASVTTALVVLTLPASSAARTVPTETVKPIRAAQANTVALRKKDLTSERSIQASLNVLRGRIVAYRAATWQCQDTLGVKRTKPSQSVWALGTSIRYRTWVASKWSDRVGTCQKILTRHTIPSYRDWQTSIAWVQRIFPGTLDWLQRISNREGGRGPWVWYSGACSSSPCLWHGYHVGGDNVSGADTVGGWLQFRYSTFAPYWRQAYEWLQANGWFVPEFTMPPPGGDTKYAAWLSPMGQALTGGYMRFFGKDCPHWGC